MPIAARIDEFGKPAWIALMIFSFIWWWPLGLAILAFMIGSGRMGCWDHNGMGRWQNKVDSMRSGINWWELIRPQAAIALSTNIAPTRCADLRKNSASLRSFCSGCVLPRTGPSSTSSWPSGAIARVTTLRNRNPNRNHLFDWSAEASSVEIIVVARSNCAPS